MILHNLKQLKEGGLRQAGDFIVLEEIRHQILTEQAQLHQGASRIAMGLSLSKATEVGEVAVVRSQKFEVA